MRILLCIYNVRVLYLHVENPMLKNTMVHNVKKWFSVAVQFWGTLINLRGELECDAFPMCMNVLALGRLVY